MSDLERVNILMVDDRPENLLALEAILDGLGQNLVKASSGEEALKCLLRHDFAVILMDVQMPGMNGLETATMIKDREKTRHVPIIFLTAINKEERYVFEGYSVGAVDYMFKPFDPSVLRSKVAVFIELYRKTEALKRQAERLRRAESKAAERQLRLLAYESQVRYRNLAEAIPQIVWTADSEGRFTYFNRRWHEFTGLEDASLDPQVWRTALHPEDVERFTSRWHEAVASGEAIELELRLRRASDESLRWHVCQACPEHGSDGRIVGWLGTCTDIDDRIRTQEALQHRNREIEAQVEARTQELAAQKRFVERLIDNAPAGIAYVDRSLVYRSVNPEFARFVGRAKAEILGQPAREVFAADFALFEPLLRSVLDTGEPHRAIGFPFGQDAEATGEAFWDVIYYPVLDQSDAVEGVLIFSLDVSDRVENERMQREQIDYLRQVDTIKDEFLSVISHELRTPLNFIMGFSSILADEVAGELSDEQKGYVAKILNGTDRMLLLVNDLLDFAKIQAGEFELFPEPQAYGALVDEVLTTLQPLADQKHISLQAIVEPALRATCDSQRIVQVLTNLVGNAIKFTPADGIVQISAHAEGGDIVTKVEDTGVGIAPEDIPRLFTRFRQLDMSRTREAGGTGLGLVICKALIEAHGGQIAAESAGPGQGSTFRFTLPGVTAPATETRENLTQESGKV